MRKNKDLNNAYKNKKDEFYTQLTDIEKEMRYYTQHFKNKTIFCNCDDPETSSFWKFFELNFDRLGLRRLIATHYETVKQSYKLEIVGDIDGNGKIDKHDIIRTTLVQNGDFRSPECIDILKQADIIITNPPFSLLREYIAVLMEYKKKFLIIANQQCITYKEIFPYFMNDEIWFGVSIHSHGRDFRVPDDYPLEAYEFRTDEQGNKYINVKGVRWLTNLDYRERHEELVLYKHYSPEEYPKYDDFDAINVDKTCDIPCDYYDPIGVPITFMDKYNPDQFEILGNLGSYAPDGYSLCSSIHLNGKKMYKRLLIRRRNNEN